MIQEGNRQRNQREYQAHLRDEEWDRDAKKRDRLEECQYDVELNEEDMKHETSN
jgi:hypothetical protein